MRALLIAIGNELRRDDGVAHDVIKRLRPSTNVYWRTLVQLTPEIAEAVAKYDAAIFIDADVSVTDVRLEPVSPPADSALSHASSPAEIVALAKALYGFNGRAFQCRIPVDDVSHGEGLSHRASALSERAARSLNILLEDLRLNHSGDKPSA